VLPLRVVEVQTTLLQWVVGLALVNLVLLSAYLAHRLALVKAHLRVARESRKQTARVLHSVQAQLRQAQDSARQADHNATLRNRPN